MDTYFVGSGKTTLLSIAAGLVSSTKKRGSDDFSSESEICINGERIAGVGSDSVTSPNAKKSFPKGLVGVVWQDDLLLSNLTVRETVEFAAKLKSNDSDDDVCREKVDQVLMDLGLMSVQHSLIGSGGRMRGISGGERKRVSVAQELVTRPSLIFLDEPTSGLDATSALALMRTLKDLAVSGGHSIVTIVHQPRTNIFELLDGLLLLSKGEEIYSGPASGARQVLESCPIIGYDLPAQTNVADWIIDIIHDDEQRIKKSSYHDDDSDIIETDDNNMMETGQNNDKYRNRILPIHWQNVKSQYAVLYQREINTGAPKPDSSRQLSTLSEIKSSFPQYCKSLFSQLQLLTKRAIKQRRGERLTRVATLVTITYIVLETIFWFRLPNDTNHIFERSSILFFLLIAQSNSVVLSSVVTFQQERALLRRERAKKMYQVLPYFLAKTTADMTTNVLLPQIHAAIVYWTVNLRPTFGAYVTYLLIFYLTTSTAQSLGLLLSVSITNVQLTLMIAPVLNIFLMIIGGFYIPLNNMSSWTKWASWLSYATYGYSGFIVNEFDGQNIECASFSNKTEFANVVDCPLHSHTILDSLGIQGIMRNTWFNVLMLTTMQISFRISAYYFLKRD